MLNSGYDIISMLENRGLNRNDAIYVLSVMDKTEIPYLINSLLSDNSESEEELRSLLYEYGIDLETEYENCEVLDISNPIYKQYGMNSKCEYDPIVCDFVESKNIPYLITDTNIYLKVPDDNTLYMIDNFISERKNMTKYTKLSESILNEKVIGFTGDIERRRLKQLAGIKEDFDIPDDVVSADTIDEPVIEPDEIVPVVTDVTDVVPTDNSEAMNTIMDCFNNIQNCLPDVRLSEYKTLVIKANELANQVKSMGGSYLSERKMKG